MRAVILRPEPGASATATRIRARGGEAIIAPLFEIAAVEWTAPDPARHDALVLTSANAIRHGGAGLADLVSLPVFAVGLATAEAARQAGFTVAHVGERDAASLFEVAAGAGITRPLHLVGADHRQTQTPSLSVTRIIVYRAEPIETLRPAAIDAFGIGAIALVHSPRAAGLFAEYHDRAGLDRSRTGVAAISAAAAEAAGGGWRALVAAAVPTDDALLAAAASLCETGVRPDRTGE